MKFTTYNRLRFAYRFGQIAGVGAITAWLLGTGCSARACVVDEPYLDQVALIESSGGKRLVGDGGKARGAYQMHKAAWEHVNRIKGWRWDWERGSMIPGVSRGYAKAYSIILRDDLRRRMKRPPTHGELYAAWNLGIGGFAARGYRVANCPETTRKAIKKLKGKA